MCSIGGWTRISLTGPMAPSCSCGQSEPCDPPWCGVFWPGRDGHADGCRNHRKGHGHLPGFRISFHGGDAPVRVCGAFRHRLSERFGCRARCPGRGSETHAWADVFVPGEGWIEFDPTNRITAGSALIRVATTRTPAQASPISGSYEGAGAVCLGLTVSVDVREAENPA